MLLTYMDHTLAHALNLCICIFNFFQTFFGISSFYLVLIFNTSSYVYVLKLGQVHIKSQITSLCFHSFIFSNYLKILSVAFVRISNTRSLIFNYSIFV